MFIHSNLFLVPEFDRQVKTNFSIVSGAVKGRSDSDSLSFISDKHKLHEWKFSGQRELLSIPYFKNQTVIN